MDGNTFDVESFGESFLGSMSEYLSETISGRESCTMTAAPTNIFKLCWIVFIYNFAYAIVGGY